MRIVLVFNTEEREKASLEYLKTKILEQRPDADVKILCRNTYSFIPDLIRFRPNIMLTPPLTAHGVSRYAYIAKLLFGTKIIAYRTEGMFIPDSEEQILMATGSEKYGPHLIDCEIFWGSLLLNLVVPKLLQQNRLSSATRSLVTGYLTYELELSASNYPLDPVIESAINQYPRENILLFLTGFPLSEYSDRDIIDSRDLANKHDKDYKINLERMKISRAAYKKYKSNYIDIIVETARKNPDCLIIAKAHPLEIEMVREGHSDKYQEHFRPIHNILYIDKPADPTDLMRKSVATIHYGSTCVATAYILNRYSIMIDSSEIFSDLIKNHNIYYYPSNCGWPNHAYIPINQAVDFITNHRKEFPTPPTMPEADEMLVSTFNFSRTKEYHPSKEIIDVLLNPDRFPVQSLYDSPQDRFFARKAIFMWLLAIFKRVAISLLRGNFSHARQAIGQLPYWTKGFAKLLRFYPAKRASA